MARERRESSLLQRENEQANRMESANLTRRTIQPKLSAFHHCNKYRTTSYKLIARAFPYSKWNQSYHRFNCRSISAKWLIVDFGHFKTIPFVRRSFWSKAMRAHDSRTVAICNDQYPATTVNVRIPLFDSPDPYLTVPLWRPLSAPRSHPSTAEEWVDAPSEQCPSK